MLPWAHDSMMKYRVAEEAGTDFLVSSELIWVVRWLMSL